MGLESSTMERVRRDAMAALRGDSSGHAEDHVERVYAMAMRFADNITDQEVDHNLVALAALLHDVDDYKLVGQERADQLSGATEIMSQAGVEESIQVAVRGIISTMGYRKSLNGVRPESIEGQIVSDADMCDAIGATGTVRCLSYALSDKGSGVVFDPDVWPNVEMTADQYNATGSTHDTDSFVNHHFEKLLKLSSMMMTEPGRQEAAMRKQVMVDFLRAFFKEQGRTDWLDFLDEYLSRQG